MGLVAPWHVGSSRTRAQTRVPYIGRWILNRCATREAQPRSILIMKSLRGKLLGETLTKTTPPGEAKAVTICVSYFTTRDPGKEHGTNKPPATRRIQERSKGERRRQSTCPTNLPESSSLESILAEHLHCHQKRP